MEMFKNKINVGMTLHKILRFSSFFGKIQRKTTSYHFGLHIRKMQTGKQCQNCPNTSCAKEPMELMSPENKVGIITGGATGIGFAAACYLLQAGARHIIITGPDKSAGEAAIKDLEQKHGAKKATFVCGDVNDACHFEEVFELACKEFGGVDILFNNAGMLNDKEWELTVDTNIKGVLRGTFLAFKYMGKDNGGKGGVVIQNASIVGLQALAGAPVYSTTKHAVIGTVVNFGDNFHYKRTGIRVCAVCPGVTITELVTGAGDKQYSEEWSKETERALKSLPSQEIDALGKGVVYVTRFGPSGTVWIVEDNKILFVEIPDRHCISTVVKDLKKS